MEQTVVRTPNGSLDAKLEAVLTRRRIARFQLWQALLAAVLFLTGGVLFATLALNGAETDASPLERAANAVAKAPSTAYQIAWHAATRYDARLAKSQRFEGEAGFSTNADAPKAGALIALARFDGDEKRGFVEIVSMDDGAVLWTYRPDLKGIYARARIPERVSHLRRDHSPPRYLPHHPLIEGDGSIVFHSMDSPLVREDACGRILWMLDGEYHHGVESDGAGGVWAIRTLAPPTVDHVGKDFQDDAVVHVSADGEILFERSISQALIKADLRHIIYSHDLYERDPLHLNDVEPAFADGRFWKKGDLFLSIRNPSMLALYRPSTDAILWTKQGPWLMQHDVDIVSDHEIGVLDNNSAAVPEGEKVLGTNRVLVYDFETGTVSSRYDAGFETADIRTKTNGLFSILADGGVMVEEQNFGRLLGLGPDGASRWTYVNRAPKDKRVYQLGWSRAIEGDAAAALKRTLAGMKCEG
jgi:hypothetical protein